MNLFDMAGDKSEAINNEEGFVLAPDLKGSPVEEDEVLTNVRASAFIDAPVFKKQKKRVGSFIFVAGGPTLLEYMDEIKKRKEDGEFICTSNKTYDFLIDSGIIPDACMIIDPKEVVKTYVKKPHKKTIFYICTVCNSQVATRLIDAGMQVEKLLVGYGLKSESDIKLQQIIYPGNLAYLVGGTMAGLRAMNFAVMMGFSKIEYYGFDSCFSSKHPKLVKSDHPRFKEALENNAGISYKDTSTGDIYAIDEPEGGFFYAYKKKRGENIQIAKTHDGRRFLTSPIMAHQAKQAIKWIERCEGKIEVVIHGDSLTAHMWKCHTKAREKSKAVIGNKRWTQSYAGLQREMHRNGGYGEYGKQDTELIGRTILGLTHKLDRRITLLDYGCGRGDMAKNLKEIFNIVDITLYDPFIEGKDKEPEGKFDIVTCFDVMEHIEAQCVENTLKFIADRARYAVSFSIGLIDAIKALSNGHNAHITQRSSEWWSKSLSKYFVIAESLGTGVAILFMCQSMDGAEMMQEEMERLVVK